MKQQQMDLGEDPKTMVTPRAFTIAQTVLYTPLATPLKRALAIMIDGLLITVLAEQMDWMFILLVIGIIWIEKRSRKFGRLLKWGLYAALLAFMLLTAVGNLFNLNTSVGKHDEQTESQLAVGEQVIRSLPALISLNLCTSYDCGKTQIQALRTTTERVARSNGMKDIELREMVLQTIADSSLPTEDRAKLREGVLNGTLWPVITLHTDLATTGSPLEPISNQSLSSAQSPHRTADIELAASQSSRTTSSDEDEATRHSIIAWIKGFMSDMGLGFGWAAFYFTVFTARFDGQTLGKKILGIRVIQLDGANISLWAAFGRYGGYAAGFTTGLLGFMQIFWDPNRQGIQDKISSTVVIDLVQMHKKQRLEQQAQRQDVMPVLTNDPSTSAHLTTSTRSEHL
ncbi:RDD family protein [Shewanella putrefaciens]|uniref:RDD domain containing protein n=1 Tax=Shewanella putrefaciens (strain CN-32 / ATCC BAA-453) TaxID=319224 RepID=A4Y807_SHEPC|nr:RDD family protein [Shewanella putrefaciens]QGS49509.1 RDD family protein [Shewanella putrefaciens]CAD6364072.1 hypothetical protein SHEWT2_01896 [Shewanella hafniensis]